MKSNTFIIISIATAIASLSTAAFLSGIGRQLQWGQADPGNTQQVALGEQVYRKHCAASHGTDLEGQPNWKFRGTDGRLPAPPHDETGHTWHHADEVLFRITRDGVSAVVPGYESDMPAYANVLADQESGPFLRSSRVDGRCLFRPDTQKSIVVDRVGSLLLRQKLVAA